MRTPNFKVSFCVAAKKAKLIAMHTTAGHANNPHCKLLPMQTIPMIMLPILCIRETFIDIRKPHTLGKNDTTAENSDGTDVWLWLCLSLGVWSRSLWPRAPGEVAP